MPFLEYYKMILDRVSFCPDLFAKEYKKAERHLQEPDLGHLNQWLDARGFQVLVNEYRDEKSRSPIEVES